VEEEGVYLKEVKISTEYIELEQLLKFTGTVQRGSDAKMVISSGAVLVNGQAELRRGKKLRPGDIVEYGGDVFKII
jgi:ribosome-associated protein